MSPQKPQPTAAMYRRRRVVALLIVLVVLVLVVWGVVKSVQWVGGLGSGEDDAAQTTAPAPANGGSKKEGGAEAKKPQPSSSPSKKPDENQTCPGDQVRLTASTDQHEYGTGEEPTLILKVKNASKNTCTLNVGTSQQEFVVGSGSDRIFSTKDCQKKPSDTSLKLKPGQEENARYQWKRERSVPECQPITAKPLPGTYNLTVKLGKMSSEKATFVLK